MAATTEMPGRRSLLSKKQELVRSEIWNAAINLFHESSYEETTVEQIAERVGISRRTFFRYYSSKEDVLASAVMSYGEALKDAIGKQHDDCPPFQIAEQAILQILEPHLLASERVIQITKRSASARNAHLHQTPLVQEELALAFAHRMKRSGKPNLDDRILANLTLFVTGLSIELWTEQRHRPFAQIVREIFARYSGVCSVSSSRPPLSARKTTR